MFPTQLSQPQREGVLDLLLLGMYADNTLRLAENEHVYNLLSPWGWESYQTPQAYAETAIAHAREAHETETGTVTYLGKVAARLADNDVKRLALGLLARLIESDVAQESEAEFYQQAKKVFGV
jgi:hypothetical protein